MGKGSWVIQPWVDMEIGRTDGEREREDMCIQHLDSRIA